MRHAVLGLVVVTLVEVFGGQTITKLDEPKSEIRITSPSTFPPCAFGAMVGQVARQVGVLVGFENTADCFLSPRLDARLHSEPLAAASGREAFNYLTNLMPKYSWKEMNGVVVVRPTLSWEDRSNVLNLPTKSFTVTEQRLDDVIHTMLHNVVPIAFVSHKDVRNAGRLSERRVTMTFRGGSLLDALNALAEAHQDMEWQLGYEGNRATIALSRIDLRGGTLLEPVGLPARYQ